MVSQWMDGMQTTIRWAVIALLIIMVAAIGSQVIARYVLNQALYWTEELGRHLMIWMVFLASVLCLRNGFHLSITLLSQRLKPQGRVVLQILVSVILGYFFYLMVVHGWTLVQKTMGQRSSAIHYPMGCVYAALPVSGLLMFVVNFEIIIKSVNELIGIRKGRQD